MSLPALMDKQCRPTKKFLLAYFAFVLTSLVKDGFTESNVSIRVVLALHGWETSTYTTRIDIGTDALRDAFRSARIGCSSI